MANMLMMVITAWIVLMNELRKALETPHASPKPAIIQGAGAGGTCLLCPGLHTNIHKIARGHVVADLRQYYRHIVLFDYEPHATKLEHLVDDAMKMLIHVGGRGSCAIAGHSMGAAVALHLAVRARAGGWTEAMNICLYAPPAHSMWGINLPTNLLVGVKILAAELDMAAACKAIGSPAELRLVHAEDDEVIAYQHSLLIAAAGTRAGMDVVFERRTTGGHQLKIS